MIPLLPKWALNSNNPAFYDTESATAIEMVAKLHGSMNTLIDDYNNYVDNTNKIIANFNESTTKDIELFKIAMRQEFQDFIDTVELKIQSQDQTIKDAIEYIQNNIIAVTTKIVNEAIDKGVIINIDYDSTSESLTIVGTNGVSGTSYLYASDEEKIK